MAAPPPVPAADGTTANFTTVINATTVGFEDTSVPAAGDTITGWSWNFGDGSPAVSIEHPTHTYATAGTFTAELTVTDSAGQTATAYSSITTTTPFTFQLGGYPQTLEKIATPDATSVNDISSKISFPGYPMKLNPIVLQPGSMEGIASMIFNFFYPGNGKIPGSPIPKHGQLLPRPL